MNRGRHRCAAHPENPAVHLTEKASKRSHAFANPLTFCYPTLYIWHCICGLMQDGKFLQV